MTARYIPIISQTLQTKYSQKQHQQKVTIENIRFKLFLPKTSLLLASFKQLKMLSINHCDLRNLENFPKLSFLQQLDLGFNQIQGTFNYLIPLKRLKYLNIEDNIVFESTKFAPLKKITSFLKSGQETSSNAQPKFSICIRNNPFITEETAYVNKLKGYGLKVIKEPKEYFDKKKNDDEKGKGSGNKNSARKGRKGETSKKEKKVKKSKYEELDSFYSGEEQSNDSSSSSSDQAPPPNINRIPIPTNSNPLHSNQNSPSLHRQRLNPHTLDSRMPIRLSHSNQLQQIRNFIDSPFVGTDENELMLEDDSSEMDNQEGGRNGQRSVDERNARLEEIREIRMIESRRRRLIREQRQRERELQFFRHIEENSERQQNRISMFSRNLPQGNIFGSMRDSTNPNGSEEDWRLNPFRRRTSGTTGLGVTQRTSDQPSNNQNHQATTISELLSHHRPMSYRNYLERVRNMDRSSAGEQSLRSPAYQPLRVRQSSDHPGIIRLSRGESYGSMHSQNSNPFNPSQEISRQSSQPGIRFQVNSDSVSDSVNDQDNDDDDDENDDNDEDNDENDALIDQDDDEMDQMMRDEDEDEDEQEDNEMIHVCHEYCEHNRPQQNQDDDDDDEKDDDNQNNDQDDNQDDGQMRNYFIIDRHEMMEPIERLELIEDEEEMIRPMIKLPQENPSSSSNLNDQLESNIEEEERQEERESQDSGSDL